MYLYICVCKRHMIAIIWLLPFQICILLLFFFYHHIFATPDIQRAYIYIYLFIFCFFFNLFFSTYSYICNTYIYIYTYIYILTERDAVRSPFSTVLEMQCFFYILFDHLCSYTCYGITRDPNRLSDFLRGCQIVSRES